MKIKKTLCILFLILLILPTFLYLLLQRIVVNENEENRKYADFPQISIGNYTNISSEFESWYKDRLPFKNQFANINATVNKELKLNSTWLDYASLTTVITGKDDWLFYSAVGDESSILDYVCNNLYTEEELAEIAERYQKAYDQYKKIGTELVLFIATNKEQVYSEYMPDNITPVGTYSRTDQLVDYLNENTDVKVIYTKDKLLEYKDKYQLFYKYDTHWNELGGFVGANLLADYILGESESLDDCEVKLIDQKAPRDLAKFCGLGAEYSENQVWKVMDYKKDVEVTETHPFPEEKDEPDRYCIANSNVDNDITLVTVNDSFITSMYSSLEKMFKNTVFSYSSTIGKDYVLENGADYLVIELVERSYHRVEKQVQELYIE